MDTQLLLIKAIRSGRLAEVQAAFDSGVRLDASESAADAGLPMGVACFMGFVDIVRELVQRGAKVNLPDNNLPTSPLNMAIRGKRTEVLRTLIELGAQVPDGMQTGLADEEILVAQWKAQRDGHVAPADQDKSLELHVEEIEMPRCFGTDTQVLDAEVMRAARGMR